MMEGSPAWRPILAGGTWLLALLLWLPPWSLLLSGPSALAAPAVRARSHDKASPHATPADKTRSKTATASGKGKPGAKVVAGKGAKPTRPTKGSKEAKIAKETAEPKPPPVPARASGKVAVFLFDGDGGVPLRARVVRLLRARGLKVTTTLRPVDSAEQYREMADTLNLAAFVDGEFSEDGDQASVTVHLRSGVSGLRIASATLASARRALPGEVDKSLWPQLGPPLAKVCVEAAKPRKREREPMRIEAGTPLDPTPPDSGEPALTKKGG